jgi:hypothetical protein
MNRRGVTAPERVVGGARPTYLLVGLGDRLEQLFSLGAQERPLRRCCVVRKLKERNKDLAVCFVPEVTVQPQFPLARRLRAPMGKA